MVCVISSEFAETSHSDIFTVRYKVKSDPQWFDQQTVEGH